MNIRAGNCRVYHNPESALKGRVTLVLGEVFVVTGVKIVAGKEALYVAMPDYFGKDGRYHKVCQAMNKEFRAEIEDVVLTAYEEALARHEQMEDVSL